MRRIVIAAIVAAGLLLLAIVIIQSRARDPEISNAADIEDAAVFEEPPSFFVSDASLLKESGFPMVETLVDEATREPVGDAPYFLQLADGRYAFGYTDSKGRTRPVFSRTKVSHSIFWYDDAWDRWERTQEARNRAAPQSGAADAAPSSRPPQAPIDAATPASQPSWRICPARRTFGCAPRSQGVAPPHGETVPQVCGCIPRCPASRPVLIAFEGEGRWPDGSRKGRFSCATAGIPSAAPARGM